MPPVVSDPRFEVDARLSPAQVNAAYAWVDWPQREDWRLDAISQRCTWFAAYGADESLLAIVRLLDDGGLHASLWDLIVRADQRRRGIGRQMVTLALDHCRDRRLVTLVSTPMAVPFFAALGFVPESHGHVAMYLRPAP